MLSSRASQSFSINAGGTEVRKIIIMAVTLVVCCVLLQSDQSYAAGKHSNDRQVRPLPKGVNVVVKVGSAYETFSTSGMSHMLEHLLFNGTTTRSQKQLYDDVDRIGGYNNAHTDNFYTDFMMVTPTENIRKGMEIQADMLFNSTLPVEKFEKEKG